MTKKSIAVITAATIIGVGTIGVTSTFAQGKTNTNPMDTLVQKIATKFHLKQSDVQAVFDEVRTERQVSMQKANDDRQSQLVKDRKITNAQKQLILQKQKEMQAEREKNEGGRRNLTPDEKRSQMDARRTELEKWAKQNNINIQYIMPQDGRGRGFGYHEMEGSQK